MSYKMTEEQRRQNEHREDAVRNWLSRRAQTFAQLEECGRSLQPRMTSLEVYGTVRGLVCKGKVVESDGVYKLP